MKSKHTGLLPFLFCIAFILSCCESGPRAKKIKTPCGSLEQAREMTLRDSSFYPTKKWLPSQWWTLFNDCQLTAFIHTSFNKNPTLQSAQANIALANATANRVRATLFPTINWGADVSRQKLSTTGIVPFGTTSVPVGPNIPEYFTLYETEFTFTYNFDIWGKNRNTLKAAVGEVNARIADTAFARLELGIRVAKVYFQLQIDYKREDIAKQLVHNRATYLQLQEKNFQYNLTNMITINSARVDLETAKEALLQIQSSIAVGEHQLRAYLANGFKDPIEKIFIENKSPPKVPLPEDLPLNLLSHRPDIIAELWIIESAGRQIEVAKAGFYPDFNLSALYGYQTIHFPELFKYPSAYYNIDPAVSLPIFDGGRLLANLCTSEINYDLAIYEYNNRILNGVKEVLDGISLVRYSNKQHEEFKKITKNQENNLHLTKLRVEHNLDSELNYLMMDESVLIAKDRESLSLGNLYQAILSLIKALGGGYNACYREL